MRADEDYNLIVQSLEVLAQLPVDLFFCSLMGMVTNGQDALKTKFDFMERLRESVLDLHHNGLSSTEIRAQVFGDENERAQVTDGHYSKQNTIDSLM